MNHNSRQTRTFIGAMALAAITSTVYAASESHQLHPWYALALMALAAATSRMKVKLPGIEGNMSVNLPFLLMAIVNLSAVEAVLIACVSTAVQCWPHSGKKFKPEQVLFNVSMLAFAANMASLISNARWLAHASRPSLPFALSAATAAFFLGQTLPVAGIINLTQSEPLLRVWVNIVKLSFPYYVVSVGVTLIFTMASGQFGWQVAIAVFPVMYGIYESYKLYFGRVAQALHVAPLVKASS
jgi:hypothetical protein